MRVTLVQAPHWSIYTPSYAVALLTGVLRHHGFTVMPKDYDIVLYRAMDEAGKRYWEDAHAAFWNDEKAVVGLIQSHEAVVEGMVDDILGESPDVVGFSVKVWSHVFSLELARRLRRKRPGLKIIFGGPHTQVLDAAGFLSQHGEVDALCRQEADLSFPAFLKACEANGGVMQPEPGFVFRGQAGEVVDGGPLQAVPMPSDIPFADYRDFDLAAYLNPRAVTMLLSRGCINRCSYCSEAPAFMRFRPYPAQRVFDEIRQHAQQVGAGQVLHLFLNDSLLNGDVVQLEALADLLIAHQDQLRVSWGGMMFIREQMTDALFAKLARSGLTNVLFGLESGSPAVLSRMRKRVRLDTAERVLASCHHHAIRTTVSVIFGHPGETEAEFHESLNFLRANACHVDLFLLNYLGLYGDCDILRHPERYAVDPATMGDAVHWVGDEGRNTFTIRNARVNLARLALGRKVGDIGGFVDGDRPLYDPFQPFRDEVSQVSRERAEAYAACRRAVRVRRFMPSRPGCVTGYFDELRQDKAGWTATGWARSPGNASTPAEAVILVDDRGKVLAFVPVREEREDVAAVLGHESLRRSGWRHLFPAAGAEPISSPVRAYAYDLDTGVATQLEGCFPWKVP